MAISEADLLALTRQVIKITDEGWRFGAAAADGGNATNLCDMNATLDPLLKGTRIAFFSAHVKQLRKDLLTFISKINEALRQSFLEYGQALNFPEESPGPAFKRIYRDYITNSKRVTSRGFVFGTPAAFTGTGNGEVVRCYFDEYGQVMEACTAEDKRIECTADANSRAPGIHQELFQITGESRGDALERRGTALVSSEFAALSSATALAMQFRNPSFSSFVPTASPTSPTAITDWTSSITVDGTNFAFRTGTAGTDYYRGYQGDTTPYALEVLETGTWALTQDLTANGVKFEEDGAYYFHIRFKRKTSADGNLVLTIGGVSATVDLTTKTNDVWYTLRIAMTADAWYRSFGGSQITLSIARTGSATTGTVVIDDFTAGKMFPADGGFWAVIGGSTPFKLADYTTVTDVAVLDVAAKIQRWHVDGPGGYLPSCPATPTAAPTAALAAAGAGNVNNGAHTYKKTWVDVNGKESGMGSGAAVTVVDKTTDGKVTVGRNETSPGAHIAYWRIYRSAAATTTPLYLLTTVAVGTSSYTDNTADASLPVTTAPAGVTYAEP